MDQHVVCAEKNVNVREATGGVFTYKKSEMLGTSVSFL